MKSYCVTTDELANAGIDTESCLDKPWFNGICKSKYHDYKCALHYFNVCKSDENIIVLCEKKVYKKAVQKFKLDYERYQGDKLEYLRKCIRRQFFSFILNNSKESVLM